MNFGEALEQLKNGKRIKRAKWGGYWALEVLSVWDGADRGKATGTIILAYLNDGETIAAAQPYQEDLLADDWEILTKWEG